MSYLLNSLSSKLLCSFTKFKNILQKHSQGFIVVTAHSNADPDATASLIVTHHIINSMGYKGLIVLPESVNAISKQVLNNLSMKLEVGDTGVLDQAKLMVIVDTSSKSQLGILGDYLSKLNYVVIDHHDINTLNENAILSIYDPKRKSTSEIITALLKYFNVKLPQKLYTLLITGILYDSRHLTIADDITLEVVAYLIKQGGDLKLAYNVLKKLPDTSEKIAKLRAAARAHIIKVSNYLIAITCVGAFEASVARSLLDLGADVGIVMSAQKDGCRTDIRVKGNVVLNNRPISEVIIKNLINKFGGSGGGHINAMVALVKANVPQVLSEIINILKNGFKEFKILEEGVCTSYL